MSLFVLPAFFALVLKVYVLAVAHSANTSSAFTRMVLVFALHNLTEVLAYLQFSFGSISDVIFRLYYAATLIMLYFMCLYCIEVSRLSILKKLVIPIFCWLIGVSLAVMFSDLLVAGVEPIGYAATAIRGSYYSVFSITILVGLLFVFSSLIVGYRSSHEHLAQVQCLYNLVALSPIVILGFLIIPVMILGYQVNAAGILPLCTTLFLLITLQSEDKHGLTDIRRFLPFSRERDTSSQIQALISRFSMDQISIKEMSNEIEKVALLHKLDQAGSVSEAARLLRVKRSTLYSMLNRHGLQSSGEKKVEDDSD